MSEALMNRVKSQLFTHEGLRLKPYRCTSGKLTIGVGPNLDDCGISKKEAHALLYIDIRNREQQLLDEIPAICSALDELVLKSKQARGGF